MKSQYATNLSPVCPLFCTQRGAEGRGHRLCRVSAAEVFRVHSSALCTPGMGVNLWGESPLYVNPVNVLNTLAKVLADGKGIFVRRCLKEARVQSYEPTDRNSIQGPVSG